jgi:hypothetical protein
LLELLLLVREVLERVLLLKLELLLGLLPGLMGTVKPLLGRAIKDRESKPTNS